MADSGTTGGPKLLKQERQYNKDKFIQDCYFGFFLNTTPLMMASQQGHLVVVKYLTEHARADVNARDTLGITPLAFATSAGRTDVAKYLLSKRALINSQEYRLGMTTLILATVNNNTEMAKLLVRHHANENLKDKAGRQAIHYAAWNYNFELVSFLARQGNPEIAINVHDNHGNTPLHLLVSDLDLDPVAADDFANDIEKDQVRMIFECLPKFCNSHVDIRRERNRGTGKVGEVLECFIKIIQMGADISGCNNEGQSVLHALCARLTPAVFSQGYLYVDDFLQTQTLLVMLHVLLRYGASCDTADYHGNTPLSLSANQQNWLAVKLLSDVIETKPRCDVIVDPFSSLEHTIETFGWNHVIEAERMERDIDFMSSALLATRKRTSKDKLAEMILHL